MTLEQHGHTYERAVRKEVHFGSSPYCLPQGQDESKGDTVGPREAPP